MDRNSSSSTNKGSNIEKSTGAIEIEKSKIFILIYN